MKTRRGYGIALGVLALVVLVLLLLRTRSVAPPEPAHLDTPAAVAADPPVASTTRASGPAPLPPVVMTTDAPFAIDVYADSQSPCAGEPVTVYASARDTRPNPVPLRVRLDGHQGGVWVYTFVHVGKNSVTAYATSIAGESASKVLTVDVRDCGLVQYVVVNAQSVRGSERFAFDASPAMGDPGCPKGDARCNARAVFGAAPSFQWTFGDGTRATTREPFAEHDYSRRPQTELESAFAVEVEVTGAKGERLRGATALRLANVAYQNRAVAGVITPLAHLTAAPRTEGSLVLAPVAFHNGEKETLKLRTAQVEMGPCDAKTPPGEPLAFDASDLLDRTELPPGESTANFSFLARRAPAGTCHALVHFFGDAPGGLRVESLFDVPFGPRNPDKEIPVDTEDPQARAQIERIEKALRLLGREAGPGATVTEDEMRDLERRGLL